jgi:hypothetical protein
MLKRVFPTAIAVVFGVLVLLGALFPTKLLQNVRLGLTEWAVVLGSFAFIVAYANLLQVHFTRLRRFRKPDGALSATSIMKSMTSLLVIISALGSLALVIWQGPGGEWSQRLLDALLIPGESTLLALTAVTLILAGMRMLRTHRKAESFLFIVTAVIFLLGTVPYGGNKSPGGIGYLAGIFQTLAMPGIRGLILGSALGITLTGLRIIFGVDHPHSDGQAYGSGGRFESDERFESERV